MISVVDDAKAMLSSTHFVSALNRAVDENPIDDFVRNDVKAIFKSNNH